MRVISECNIQNIILRFQSIVIKDRNSGEYFNLIEQTKLETNISKPFKFSSKCLFSFSFSLLLASYEI